MIDTNVRTRLTKEVQLTGMITITEMAECRIKKNVWNKDNMYDLMEKNDQKIVEWQCNDKLISKQI